MGTNKRNESSFLVQGSILAIASIVSRIIGLIYRMPLTAIIGDIGNDYYATAMDVYNILLLISSYSLPLAVSKLVSTRMAKGQRKNAYRIFKGAMIFALISGTIAGLIIFFGADMISRVMKTPLSVFALQVMAPTLLIMAILGVVRGFFQGMGTMMPTAISQLIEQVANAIVSIWMAYTLYGYGARVAAVLGSNQNYGEAYGAAGGTIGTGAGTIFALGFVLLVFILYIPIFKRQTKRDISRKQESYREVFQILFLTIVPVLLSTTIYNVNTIVDQWVFKNLASYQGYESIAYGTMWGVYSGKFNTLSNVPIALASALASSSVPSIATAFAERDIKQVKRKIRAANRFVMVIVVPCAVGMAVLANPIMDLLFAPGNAAEEAANIMAANLLRVGAISIVFFSLSTVSNAILQGINRMKKPVHNACIALITHVLLLVILMLVFDLNIYGVVIAKTFFSFMMCILNGLAIRKYLRYRQEVRKTFLIPAISSAIMGGAVYGVYKLLMMLAKSSIIATIISVCVGVVVYGVFLFLLRGLNEEDLKSFPGGRTLMKITKKLHLLK